MGLRLGSELKIRSRVEFRIKVRFLSISTVEG